MHKKSAAKTTLLNVRETANKLGVHENTIRNWEKRGILRAVRLPGSKFRRFNRATIEKLQEDMVSQLAPADTGPVVTPRSPLQREILHGDDDSSF